MNDVAKPSAEHERLCELWRLPRTLMGGTRAMRLAGKAYLPQEAAESDPAYDIRLKRSTLFNGFRKTVKDMSGKVFAKPIAIGADVPPQIKQYGENIDLAGRNLDVFAYDVFRDGLQAGISHILVEMDKPVAPKQAPNGSDLPVTIADERAAGLRPYLCHIKAENLIGWKSETISGAETLTQIRIRECVSVPDGEFHEKEIEQIRVFDRLDGQVSWRIFRKAKNATTKEEEWTEHDRGFTSLPEITLCPVYINRTGFMMGEPPLEDLADINVAHWQSQSDQRNILHVARVPILFGSGIPDDAPQVQIGAGVMSRASDPNAKLVYVEHTGQAIESGREDLKDLEFQMQTMGLELLIPKPGGQSATGEAIDQAKMNSPLAMMANALKDALEQAFGYMAEYMRMGDGDTVGGSLTVNTDFGVTMRDAADLQTLLQAVNAGKISRDTFWKELVRRGVLADDFSADDEADKLDSEGPALGAIGREDEFGREAA